MRSIFSAGVLDGFLAQDFNPFGMYIGVSAGAYNLSTYLAGTSGASLHTYLSFATQTHFISYARFLRGGHLLDLDWLYEAALTHTQADLDAIYEHGKPFYVAGTDVESGQARYLDTNARTLRQALKASAALPLLYRDFPVFDGCAMTDGGVADSIPVAEAIRLGAKRLMVIRARPHHYIKIDTPGHRLIRWHLRKHRVLTATMRQRVRFYQATLDLLRNPPPGIEIIEICPPENLTFGRFNRQRARLQAAYECGLTMAWTAMQAWENHQPGPAITGPELC